MGTFFKNNDFKTDYKKRPNDEYKAALSKLDDETKKKFDRRRAWVLVAVIVAVFIMIIVLAVTGVGTNKADNAGNILGGTKTAVINCLGDSVTEGLVVTASGEAVCSTTYPDAMKAKLEETLEIEADVHNYGTADGKAENTSYKKMNEAADIAILLYTYENYKAGEDPEGILESNIDGLSNQGCLVYLVTYPYASFAEDAMAVKQANQYIAKAAKAKNILLLDACANFTGLLEQGHTEEELFSTDGVHLSETGYELLGQFIAGGLVSDARLD